MNLEPIWWIENNKKSNKYSTLICLEYFNLIKEYILEDKLNLIIINDKKYKKCGNIEVK